MGKDIDRNITRQLFEKNKNSFTRNDVIPVENGGTGVTNLEDYYITTISVNTSTPAVEGFTFNRSNNYQYNFKHFVPII